MTSSEGRGLAAGDRRSDGKKANHALTLEADHLSEADHRRKRSQNNHEMTKARRLEPENLSVFSDPGWLSHVAQRKGAYFWIRGRSELMKRQEQQ